MTDDMRELIGAYALDAVDASEAKAVEALVETDPELRAELDSYRQVMTVLVESTEPSPSTVSPAVWERITAEISASDVPDRVPSFASVTDIRSSKRWSRLGAIVAVAAVAASLVLGVRVVDLQNRLDDDATLEEVAAAAMRDPDSVVVNLDGQEGFESSSARIVLGDDGVGYIISDTLAGLGSDRTYQLWAIVADGGDQRIISAGVLGPDPDISQFQTTAEVVGFAITEEVAGGVAVSEAPAIALWVQDA